jgi:hypothetical protein
MNLAIVVYTNETNLPILQLFLDYFFKHNLNFNLPVYVVGNRFTKSDLPHLDKVKYIAGDVEFHYDGKHFSETLRNVIPQIKEEYIFYFCEDYILTYSIDQNSLTTLMQMIQYENIDLFTFGSVYPVNHGFSLFDKQYFEIPLYHVDLNYQHAYNVQPGVWKKQSLLQLLNDNPSCSLHDMDNSILNNKDKYKVICTNLKIYDGCCLPDYFIIGYKEIIRHGVFLLVDNGTGQNRDNHIESFIQKLIKDNNLHKKPEYDRYILFDKNIIDKW